MSLGAHFLVLVVYALDAWQRLTHPRTDWLAR